jgi:hypothetical protein
MLDPKSRLTGREFDGYRHALAFYIKWMAYIFLVLLGWGAVTDLDAVGWEALRLAVILVAVVLAIEYRWADRAFDGYLHALAVYAKWLIYPVVALTALGALVNPDFRTPAVLRNAAVLVAVGLVFNVLSRVSTPSVSTRG